MASLAASTNDIDAPDFSSPPPVVIKKRISSLSPCACTCLLKVKNSKSFDHAVIAGAKFPNAKAETGSRDLSLKVHCNSPTKCSASAQEPPFPATNIFLLFFCWI